VPLLLTMNELAAALTKASASADVELMHLVLLHAKGSLAEPELFQLLSSHSDALELLADYCRAREPELLKTLYYHANQPIAAAGLAISEAYRAPSWAQRMRGLSIALQFYEHSHHPNLARGTEEQLKLLDAQRHLERTCKGLAEPSGAPPPIAKRFRFVDTPLNETVYKCFAFGQAAAGERLKTECKIPEKRWWTLKLRGLSHARDWAAVAEMAASARRSPIGWRPFVDACIEQSAHDEAAKYIAKLTPAEAVPLYLQIARTDEARALAIQHKEKQPALLELCLKAAERAATGSG